ncbi:neprilysin-like isoform X3 [Dermacentor albipictus]|uniref:neprilysin-like isoform X3 n=1 Tax=Dermacentor albipictus TaxID=60249 RepID=UPI0038FCCB81
MQASPRDPTNVSSRRLPKGTRSSRKFATSRSKMERLKTASAAKVPGDRTAAATDRSKTSKAPTSPAPPREHRDRPAAPTENRIALNFEPTRVSFTSGPAPESHGHPSESLLQATVRPLPGGEQDPPQGGGVATTGQAPPYPRKSTVGVDSMGPRRSKRKRAAESCSHSGKTKLTHLQRKLANAASAEPAAVGPRAVLAMAVACLATVLVITALVAYIRSTLHPWHQERDDGMCRNPPCRGYAQLFLVNVNWTVNPCSDFEAYVCSKWKPSSDPYAYGSALATYAIQEWFNVFHTMIVEGPKHFAAARKAQAMFEACLTNSTANGSSAALLRQFMLERKIPWPDDPLPNASPLGVLVDLAYNWRLNVWFQLKARRTPQRAPHILIIASADFSPLWSAYKETAMRAEGIVPYWNRFHDAFAAHQPRRSEEEIEKIENVEQNVLAELHQVFDKDVAAPCEFLLKDIASITTNLSSQRWIEELNANARVHGGYGLSDRIVASDVALLEAVGKLFSKFDRRSLLLHISWFFIQAFAPLEHRSLLPISTEGTWHSMERRRRLCSTRVEMSYKVLIRSLVALTIFTAQSRKAISGYLGLVTQLARNKMSALSWFADESFTRAASSKFQSSTVVLWPPKDLLTDEGLTAMYANFSANEVSVVEHWVNGMKAKRALRKQPKYEEVQDYPLSFMQPLFRYDYIMNRVLISAAALRMPAYSGQGTKAMLYGGLGFSYALQLVKALDPGGLRVDADGNVHSWAPKGWSEAIANRSTLCHGLSSGKSLFPEVPALEVAHAAYEMAPGDTPHPGRVTMAFNEDQVFFITVCLSLCNLSPTFGSIRGDCNKAVANFANFARAFKCAPRDPMNPETRCSFFN